MRNTTHAKELVRLRTGREVEELLRELYLQQRATHEEIAVQLGITRGTVALWLAEYGIRRADRAPVVLQGRTA